MIRDENNEEKNWGGNKNIPKKVNSLISHVNKKGLNLNTNKTQKHVNKIKDNKITS